VFKAGDLRAYEQPGWTAGMTVVPTGTVGTVMTTVMIVAAGMIGMIVVTVMMTVTGEWGGERY
jgi:hypothetical protein